ncbi:MAG: HNH endonuclease signature motif containing protein [Myxococcota bacterium]
MHVRSASRDDWRQIDRKILDLASRQGQLDLELGECLLAAKRVRVHKYLGFGSFSEYVTRRLGYNAKSALDRLRVAEALERLPKLRGMLRRGERSWSALREITRRATPANEDAWIARTEGKTVREIERMAAVEPDGRGPDATYRVVVELSAADYADFLAAAEHAREDIGPAATKQEVFMAMVHRELGRRAESVPGYQTAVTLCAGCERTWRREAGQAIEVADAVGGCARCDGELVGATLVERPDDAPAHAGPDANAPAHAGSDDDANAPAPAHARPDDDAPAHAGSDDDAPAHAGSDDDADAPAPAHAGPDANANAPAHARPDANANAPAHVGRPSSALRPYVRRRGAPGLLDVVAAVFAGPMRTVTPALRRAVRARDGGRCVVPGCTNIRFIDVHHLRPAAQGGPHTLENLVSLCTAHHQRLHDGVLSVEPDGAGRWSVRQADGAPYGSTSSTL